MLFWKKSVIFVGEHLVEELEDGLSVLFFDLLAKNLQQKDAPEAYLPRAEGYDACLAGRFRKMAIWRRF